MWKVLSKGNFREVAAFNCAIVRLFGYFYFSHDAIRRTSRALVCDEYLRLAFYLILGLYVSLKSSNVNVGTRNSLIFEIGLTVLLQITVFMPTAFRILNFVVRRRHARIIETVEWIDARLMQMGIEINHSKHFRAALTITLSYFFSLYCTLALDQVLFTLYLHEIELDMVEGVFAAVNVVAYLSYQITHMLLIVTMYLRVQYLNRVIESRTHDMHAIRRLRKIHLRLYDTMQAINGCYALNLLNFFFQFVFFNIFFYFGLIHFVIADSVAFEEVIFSIIVFGYVQFFFWFGAWIILHSSLLRSEVDTLESNVLSQVMFAGNRKRMKHFNIFNFQLHHTPICVSAGLFVIDWTFLFGIFTTTFSYLIILIQFDTA